MEMMQSQDCVLHSEGQQEESHCICLVVADCHITFLYPDFCHAVCLFLVKCF